MDRLKVGVIGVGSMGSNHIRVYSEFKNCEIVGVVDASNDVLKKIKESYNIDTFTNIDNFLKTKRPDAVSIAVPTNLHYEVAKDVISNGVHVLVEKPITDDLKKADEIIKLAKNKNVKLMVGHIERFNPMVQRIKKVIDSIGVDKIYHCAAYRLGPEGRPNDSVVLDLCTHDIDVLRYLLNSEVVKVYASAVFKNGVEKHIVVNLEFSCGVRASITSSLLYPFKKRELVILGQDFVIEGDYQAQDVSIYRKKKISIPEDSKNSLIGEIEYEILKPLMRKSEPLKAELIHFINCVLENKKPLIDGEEGKKNLEIAFKIIEKCREGK